MSAMVGSHRSGAGAVPADVMIEIARNPDAFEERIKRYTTARDEARKAQSDLNVERVALKQERERFESDREDVSAAQGLRASEFDRRARSLEELEANLSDIRRDMSADQAKVAADRAALDKRYQAFVQEQSRAQQQLIVANAALDKRAQDVEASARDADAHHAELKGRATALSEVRNAIRKFQVAMG